MSLTATNNKQNENSALPQALLVEQYLQDDKGNGKKINSKTSSLKQNKKLDFSSAKALIVEDEEVSQAALSSMLISLGCRISIAKTGRQAIDMYKDNYDIIFLDIGLPDVTGVGVCMAIRSQEHFKHTPIIAITAHEEMKEECLAVGIDEFITKPLTPGKCKEILVRWLSVRKDKN